MMMLALTMSVATFAQFEKGKLYVGTGLTGATLNYTGSERWKLDVNAKLGYMLENNWMGLAYGELNCRKYEHNAFAMGLGVRRYFDECGIYAGVGIKYAHFYCGETGVDDFLPTAHLGYAFFLNRTVTIEPEVCYSQSLKSHSDYSGLGFRLNFGIYFEDLFK